MAIILKSVCRQIHLHDPFSELLPFEFRPLVDTFRMYLCADTDTFPQNVSVPIQIQFQKMYLCADTDTFY